MSKNMVAALFFATISLGMIGYSIYLVNEHDPISTTARATLLPTLRPTFTLAPTDSASESANGTKVYLIAIDDQGKSGQKIGCGDSLIAVSRANQTETIKAALTDLFSIPDRTYGQSGLYNALYQSKLSVKSVVLKNGIANVYLTGTITQGGVCDAPRIQSQLEATAKQFSMVKEVHFFLNSKPLSFSEEGE